MSRTKELKITVSELGCYSQLVAELNKKRLLADYDLSSIELKVKHNKPKPILKKDVVELINNLLRYQPANRERLINKDSTGEQGVPLQSRFLLLTEWFSLFWAYI